MVQLDNCHTIKTKRFDGIYLQNENIIWCLHLFTHLYSAGQASLMIRCTLRVIVF